MLACKAFQSAVVNIRRGSLHSMHTLITICCALLAGLMTSMSIKLRHCMDCRHGPVHRSNAARRPRCVTDVVHQTDRWQPSLWTTTILNTHSTPINEWGALGPDILTAPNIEAEDPPTDRRPSCEISKWLVTLLHLLNVNVLQESVSRIVAGYANLP